MGLHARCGTYSSHSAEGSAVAGVNTLNEIRFFGKKRAKKSVRMFFGGFLGRAHAEGSRDH